MRRILMGTVLAAAMLVTPAVLQARGHGSRGSSSHTVRTVRSSNTVHSSPKNFHLTNAKKFSGGYFFKGKQQNHWKYRCWWKKYGCYCFWCPSTCCWYYYCDTQDSYFPVSYADNAPPNANGASVAGVSGGEGEEAPVPPEGAGSVQPFSMSPGN